MLFSWDGKANNDVLKPAILSKTPSIVISSPLPELLADNFLNFLDNVVLLELLSEFTPFPNLENPIYKQCKRIRGEPLSQAEGDALLFFNFKNHFPGNFHSDRL